jgi:hypothetical protein
VALLGSKAGCLSFALFGFFGFLFGSGSFWAVWIGFSLGSRVFSRLLLGYLGILSCVLGSALHFFDIYNIIC